jgi:DNA-binding transcriptional ArsR family regulator
VTLKLQITDQLSLFAARAVTNRIFAARLRDTLRRLKAAAELAVATAATKPTPRGEDAQMRHRAETVSARLDLEAFAAAARLESCTLLLLPIVPDEGIARGDLRELAMIADTSLSSALKALRGAGLVEHGAERPRNDGRRLTVKLTARAHAVLDAMRDATKLPPDVGADYETAAAWEGFHVEQMKQQEE